MIIHGSMAAILRGEPFERDPKHRSDIDIYGSQEDSDYLVEYFKKDSVVGIIPSAYMPNRFGILVTKINRKEQIGNKNVDFEILPANLLSAIESLPDNNKHRVFDKEVFVTSELTDSIIKRSYRNSGEIFKQKHQKDIDNIKLKNYKLLPEHIEFFKLLKDHSKDYLAKLKT